MLLRRYHKQPLIYNVLKVIDCISATFATFEFESWKVTVLDIMRFPPDRDDIIVFNLLNTEAWGLKGVNKAIQPVV